MTVKELIDMLNEIDVHTPIMDLEVSFANRYPENDGGQQYITGVEYDSNEVILTNEVKE